MTSKPLKKMYNSCRHSYRSILYDVSCKFIIIDFTGAVTSLSSLYNSLISLIMYMHFAYITLMFCPFAKSYEWYSLSNLLALHIKMVFSPAVFAFAYIRY